MNKMTNLVESLKLLGFQADEFGKLSLSLPIYLDDDSKASRVTLVVDDFETGETPTEETTQVCIIAQTQTKDNQDLDTFHLVKEVENV